MGKASRHKRERHFRLAAGNPDHNWTKTQHPEDLKISASLIELIDPWLDDAASVNEVRFITSAAAIAWNLASLPEPERSQALENFTASMEDEPALLFDSLISELIERKRVLFPDDPRTITGWDVRKKNGQPYITVSAVIDVPAPDSGDTASR